MMKQWYFTSPNQKKSREMDGNGSKSAGGLQANFPPGKTILLQNEKLLVIITFHFPFHAKLIRKENSEKNHCFKFLKFDLHFCRQLCHLKRNAQLQKRGLPNVKGILFLAFELCCPKIAPRTILQFNS